jgi:oxygen-independent coproporphyrinogen III oxidase
MGARALQAGMNSPPIEFDPDLIRRFDRGGPRYTSYPTADRFVEAFGEKAYRTWAARRNTGGIQRALSLYLHLPFCRDVCYYCACNKIVTRDTGKTVDYLEYLGREIDLQAELFRDDPRVVQMHWGGGTPTYYDSAALAGLFARLADRFDFSPHGEYSIEVDPRTVDAGAIHSLREIGFNRVSFGVQDFDPRVQEAIHRVQDEEHTRAVIEAAHRAGFESINVDMVYGLPRQTPASLDATLAKVIAMRPGRIAIYNYAHLPTVFKAQRGIDPGDMPSPETKLVLLDLAIDRLCGAGYVSIGMDHFALLEDALALGQRQGRLHRNFQGYTTCGDCDLVGLGMSAISAVGPTYSQNHRALDDYYDCLDRGQVPIMRGIELSADDLVRRSVIQALMCHYSVSKEAVEIAHLLNFDRYFATELAQLAEFQDLGLIKSEDGWLTVTSQGRFLIRSICMVFDRYLKREPAAPRYSRII